MNYEGERGRQGKAQRKAGEERAKWQAAKGPNHLRDERVDASGAGLAEERGDVIGEVVWIDDAVVVEVRGGVGGLHEVGVDVVGQVVGVDDAVAVEVGHAAEGEAD